VSRRLPKIILAALALPALLALGLLWHLNDNDGLDPQDRTLSGTPAELLARGAYLARAGNCIGCHTARGGAPGAGGAPIATPFGTVYTSNLTPDDDTGLGRWPPGAFRRALLHGRSADGRLLYPAFPYTHTTLLTRGDVDALYTYFRSLPPVHARPPAHTLRWPYSSQAALAVWRALYFRPGPLQPDPARPPARNPGAYLVRAVAHCSACHAPRDRLGGAQWDSLAGGLMAAQGWYAPSLLSAREASVADWPVADIARLLGTGHARAGQASGPMAEVVLQGTQHLHPADLNAIATYLKALPGAQPPAPPASAASRSPARLAQAGQKLYEQHCADCHGLRGEGLEGAFPALAGNRAVTLPRAENLLQTVLFGGYGAATAGHPRPHGMPPFALTLGDADVAAVLSYIRTSWGHQAPEVSPLDVHAMRAAQAAGAPR
jgi:mono/diheme cytochrome c family protein